MGVIFMSNDMHKKALELNGKEYFEKNIDALDNENNVRKNKGFLPLIISLISLTIVAVVLIILFAF